MRRLATTLSKDSCIFQRATYSSWPPSSLAVGTIHGSLHNVDVNEFRERAFGPQRPILITDESSLSTSIPAASRWFSRQAYQAGQASQVARTCILQDYLEPFGDTIVPYEVFLQSLGAGLRGSENGNRLADYEGHEIYALLADLIQGDSRRSFHRFNAPLSLFLQACSAKRSIPLQLYIAQAQIADLPKQLQEDLPIPRVVKESGNGDIYDANIWLGLPPTYTPLHKDPNPNLFVQLASSKSVRLFAPHVGAGILHSVRLKIGQSSSLQFRGEEMMEGPEREALHSVVWGDSIMSEGLEAVVKPGEALFIPKGWWHSIKSIGDDVTGSVNWWFR